MSLDRHAGRRGAHRPCSSVRPHGQGRKPYGPRVDAADSDGHARLAPKAGCDRSRSACPSIFPPAPELTPRAGKEFPRSYLVVIERRRGQRSFGDGLIATEVGDLHEAWMRQADRVLEDPQIVAAVYEALARRYPKSCSHGRLGKDRASPAAPAAPCTDRRLVAGKRRSSSSIGGWDHANNKRSPTPCIERFETANRSGVRGISRRVRPFPRQSARTDARGVQARRRRALAFRLELMARCSPADRARFRPGFFFGNPPAPPRVGSDAGMAKNSPRSGGAFSSGELPPKRLRRQAMG